MQTMFGILSRRQRILPSTRIGIGLRRAVESSHVSGLAPSADKRGSWVGQAAAWSTADGASRVRGITIRTEGGGGRRRASADSNQHHDLATYPGDGEYKFKH